MSGVYYCDPALGSKSNCAAPGYTGCITGTYPTQSFASSCSLSANGYSNTNIPYFTGNVEINWTSAYGMRVVFGETLLGNNNSFNQKAFGIGYASVRVPITGLLSVQVSGDNIFNALKSNYDIEDGVPYTLANGQVGATIGNTLGPAVWKFELTKSLSGP